MTDYKNAGGGLQDQGRKTLAVVPGNADLSSTAKGLLVLAAGDVTVVPIDNADAETVAFTGLTAGQFIPLVVRRVTAATATVVAVIG
ncbi:spike base protein, RCAP_Rcc01079 family [Agrobacterium vitis]